MAARAPLPGLPTPSFQLQGCRVKETPGFTSPSKPVLPCPTPPCSRPVLVACGKSCKARGCLGCSSGPWLHELQDLLCFPFKEKLKRLHGANAACHSSASGDTAMVQTQEREDRAHHLIWSWQPSMAGTNLHCVRMLPVSPFAAHMVCGAGGTGTMALLASFP